MKTDDQIIENDHHSKLSKISWMIIAQSLLIDTCHARAFPSYNIMIGICAKLVIHYSIGKTSDDKNESVLLYSCLSAITTISIIIDIIYCLCWGREIIDGENKSAKFSMFFLVSNMFVKAFALLYSSAAQILACEDYESSSKSIGNMSKVDKSNEEVKVHMKISNDDLSEDSNDYIESTAKNFNPTNHEVNLNIPLPPFTPGLSGLVSPHPRKLNHGMMPPPLPSPR